MDEYRLPALYALEPLERYAELESILHKADEDGVITALPAYEGEVRSKELVESRIRTIRTRLYLLGYLKRDNKSAGIDENLKKAIRTFQGEAGLKQDSWVGAKTWRALQELVSFEHPSNIGRWMRPQHPNPALERAIKLRLFVLGFLRSKQSKDQNKINEALKKFVKIAEILHLTDSRLLPDYSIQTIAALFDQDHIAERLAGTGEFFIDHCPAELSEKQAQRSIRRFIVCVAKIELWLLGYDVRPDGTGKFEVPPYSIYSPEKYPLFHALHNFWTDNGRSTKDARKIAKEIKGIFFITLLRLQQEGERSLDTNDSHKLYEALVQADLNVLDKVWQQIKSIGSRIWDGLKRAWGWFKSLVIKGVKKITAWAKNIARLTYQYAIHAFTTVKRILKAMSKFILHKTYPGSDINHLVIQRDNDFDYRLFMSPGRHIEVVEKLLSEFHTSSQLFKLGARILAMLIDLLIHLVKNVFIAFGWFGLILALVEIYSKLKELNIALDEKEAFLAVA